MEWSEARSWEARGLSFGAHTVTHPILSRTSDERSRQEIADSWARLREMVPRPVPMFCYPNGSLEDFGPREFVNSRDLEFEGALSTISGHAEVTDYRAEPDGRFRVRRLNCPDASWEVARFVSGA